MRPLAVRNYGYANTLWEIRRIMVNDQITRDYEDYLSATEDDKVAAAILALASVFKEGIEEEKKEEPKKE